MRLIGYGLADGRLEELRGDMILRGQDFDALSISQFCDMVWATVCKPPPMVNHGEWRRVVHAAFYLGVEAKIGEDGEAQLGPGGSLPTDAAQRLEEMREMHRRAKDRREAAVNTD